MKAIKENIKKHWYAYVVELVIFVQLLVFLICRENSYIAIHDNLDLFVAHFRIMKLNDAFFGPAKTLPMLGGVSRDLFGSEWSLYNILYAIFPSFTAYMIGYFLKILIGYGSFLLLVREIYPNTYKKYLAISSLVGLCYGLIPVFPAYGIAFTSVPLLIILVRRLYMDDKLPRMKNLDNRTDKQAMVLYRVLLYLGVFLYPLLSYFSYHGFFLLCYMCVAVIIFWIKDKKFPRSIFFSIVVLSIGYVCFEYRLFRAMLFDDTVTIRTTMVNANLTLKEMFGEILEVFLKTIFHGQDSHMYLVLPISVIGLIVINYTLVKDGRKKEILKQPVNMIFVFIIFNCLIYGLYDYEPFRSLVEKLIPKLTGFQFNRTIFFNPFLWYCMLFCMLKALYDAAGITYVSRDIRGKSKDTLETKEGKKVNVKISRIPSKFFTIFANCIAVLAVAVVTFEPQVYNDFYYTCYNYAYKMILHRETSTLNYREFYSENLFDEVKSDLNYDGEWAVAYGMHPAVLQYNGISTLDGYLGMYSVEYKEKFGKVIEPALETSPEFKTYFDDWGARAYIYSDNNTNSYAANRSVDDFDDTINIDAKALKEIDCTYLISRVQISNADEQGLSLRGIYEEESSPYMLYVYTLE